MAVKVPGSGRKAESALTQRRKLIQESVDKMLAELHTQDPVRWEDPKKIYAEAGYDPLVAMARIGHDLQVSIDIRANMHAKIAAYMHPQLRSVEVGGNDGQPIELKLNKVDQIVDMMDQLLKKIPNAAGK